MKCRLTATVEGVLHVPAPKAKLSIEQDGVLHELEGDEQGLASTLSVTCQIPPDRSADVRASIEDLPPGSRAQSHLTLSNDPEVVRRLTSCLQAMESHLSFGATSLVRIRWHEAKESLIPETDEERARVEFWEMSVTAGSRRRHGMIDQKRFETLVQTAPRYSSLVTLMSFMREGFNSLDVGQYVQAFYSYYFVIEDMFADGKTGEGPVLKAFSANLDFCEVCRDCLTSFQRISATHMPALKTFFDGVGCDLTVEGLQRFLFRMRGNLHHYSHKSTRRHGNPFNQGDFEAVTMLVMHVATSALLRRIVEINREHAGLPR